SPSYITSPRYRYKQTYLQASNNDPLNTNIDTVYKSDVWRFSFMPKIGVEGELTDDIYINASVGFQTLNLLGRDNRRGELLTPITDFETQESLVKSFVFSFMLQYH